MPMILDLKSEVRDSLNRLKQSPDQFTEDTYTVDSGSMGIFSHDALKEWDTTQSDLDLDSLDREFQHKKTGQRYVQVYGARDKYPKEAICFFRYDSPIGPDGRDMNQMVQNDEVEEIPREVLRELNYNSSCSVTCNTPYMGLVTGSSPEAQAFYSRTTCGDGQYGVFRHLETGIILVDTGNALDVIYHKQAAEAEDITVEDLVPVEMGSIFLGNRITIIDPGYLKANPQDGVILPALGHYRIFRLDAPDEKCAGFCTHQGFALVPTGEE